MKSKKKRGSRFFSAMSTFFTNTTSDTVASEQEPSKPKSNLQKKSGICSALIEDYAPKRKPVARKMESFIDTLDAIKHSDKTTSTMNFLVKNDLKEEIPIVVKINGSLSLNTPSPVTHTVPSTKQPFKCDSFLAQVPNQSDKETIRKSLEIFVDDKDDSKIESMCLDKSVDPFSKDMTTTLTRSQSVNNSAKHSLAGNGSTPRCERNDVKLKIAELESIVISDDDDVDTKLYETKDISFESPDSSTSKAKQSEVAKQAPKERDEIMISEDAESFQCLLCDIPFHSKRNYDRHLAEHKRWDKRYKCSVCGKGFYWKGFLVRHLKDHLSSSQYGSGETQIKDNNDPLQLELKKVEELDLDGKNDDRINEQNKASQISIDSNKSTLVKLIHDINGGVINLACGYCDQCFPSQRALVNHCRTHMSDRPFMCNICGTLFQQNAALVYHTRIHFDMIRSRQKRNNNVPYIKYVLKLHSCHDCNRSYVSWPALNQHRENVHGESCNNVEESNEEKIDPVNNVEADNDQAIDLSYTSIPSPDVSNEQPSSSSGTSKKYFCYQCRETFISQILFKKHPCCKRNCPKCGEPFKSKFHKDSSTYKCCLCETPSTSIGDLKRHLLTHLDFPTSHVCDKCGKMFKLNKGLIRHQKIHVEGGLARRFRCETCDKAFRWRGNLLRHVKVHLSGRQYQCKNCYELFASDVDLLRHKFQCNKLSKANRFKNEVKVYNCEVCDEVFSERLKFRKHYLSHFGISTSVLISPR